MTTACTPSALRTWSGAWLRATAVLLALCSAPASMAQTTPEAPEITALPTQLQVHNQTLQRNGAGVRYKAIFRVYAAALYLEKPAKTLEEIGQLQGPKRVTVRMLRNINASELGKLFAHGMEDNMDKQQFSKLIPGVMRMSDVFNRHKELKTGDQFTLDWIPEQGMVLSINGQADPAEFKEPEFFQAMLGIWLGPKPADGRLKSALLGTSPMP